jgi:hypothetical protein
VEDALAFFERVYGEVPEWVRTMHEQRPETLNDYLRLRRTSWRKVLCHARRRNGYSWE